MKDKLLEIIKNYGVNNQLRKLNEEVFELQESIIGWQNKSWNLEGKSPEVVEPVIKEYIMNIAQEIADCYVMLEQFRLYYGIPKEKIKEVMEYKINRQIDRIEDNLNN